MSEKNLSGVILERRLTHFYGKEEYNPIKSSLHTKIKTGTSNWIFRLLSICIFLFLASSCEKESDPSDSIPSNDECYFEFKLDGVYYSSSDCISSTLIQPTLVDSLVNVGANLNNNELDNWGALFSVIVNTNDTFPILIQHPSALTSDGVVLYFSIGIGLESIYVDGDNTEGSFTFTELDQSDGWIEGDFEFTDIDKDDVNGVLISTGHTISEGHYRLKVE